ncbi:MAG: GNAT family N-acetyltransferase [Alphaproteobacteria bacterium]|nr:GNAT family N-acetyltransferase [Alphaproteobacteria bacterium]
MIIYPAGPDQVVFMSLVHGAAFPRGGWSREAFSSFLESPHMICFAVRLESKLPLAGFILVRVVEREGEIITLAVHPVFWRRGIASCLLGTIVKELRCREVSFLFLEVAVDNEEALHLYLAHGFVQTGRRVGYYHRETGCIDALSFSFSLSDWKLSPPERIKEG